MILKAKDIFSTLSAWPHRGTGTDQEQEARETLSAHLTGIPGAYVTEEGFKAPASYIPFFWTVALGQLTALYAASAYPTLALIVSVVFYVNFFLFMDWRKSPLAWWWSNRLTANLVASKGEGARLVILMAHLDSAPASFAYRQGQVEHFKRSHFSALAVFFLPVLFAVLSGLGLGMPSWVLMLAGGGIVFSVLLASVDFWRYGYTPGANDNLTGVAAVTEVATSLWHDMPADTEVRLVITSAEEAGMLGAQHYFEAHRDELLTRQAMLLNIDTVGVGKLAYVSETGTLSPVRYTGILAQTARLLAGTKAFPTVRAHKHKVGDFDSVWFARAGIPSVTVAAYDAAGLMPAIHTPGDRADRVDLALVSDAARFSEAVVRTALTLKQGETDDPV